MGVERDIEVERKRKRERDKKNNGKAFTQYKAVQAQVQCSSEVVQR